ncbi:hypothetical protein LZC95_25505 [Pendulispora brunnea]|uniref:Lipid/polyisoprenoid-binding YceI-like domain-containing protein n=1 Tax=Pendulispora brunnea TaxID=2905690 RepID=A0ABZ2KNA9_9BACT
MQASLIRLAYLGCFAAIPLAALGCSKSEDAPKLAASASSLTVEKPPPTAMVAKYTIATDGKTHIDGPAPAEHLKGDTSASAGSLDVDLMNLANTRGEVKIDLTTLKTHTFDADPQDSKQTKDAAGWLEVGDAVSADVREANRWAVYSIRSIDELSASDVTKVAPVKQGADDVRVVTLMSHGELLLHGHKADKVVPLEARFHFPSGAAADARPTSIEIVTKSPLKITIAEHDVKPRDNLGKLAKRAFGLLGTKVADVLDVTFELRATPQSQ